MTYSQQLHPWCITRTIDDKKQIVVARFRRRDDAVAYLTVLRKSIQGVVFKITFDSKN